MCVVLCCARFFDRPVVPLPPPPEAWQHHPPVEPPQWPRGLPPGGLPPGGLPPDFPPRFLPAPEVPLVSELFLLHRVITCLEQVRCQGI